MSRLWTVAGQHYRTNPAAPVSDMPVGDITPDWAQIYADDFDTVSSSGSILTLYPRMAAFDNFTDTSGVGTYSKNAPTVTAHDSMLDVWIHYDAATGKRFVACVLPNGYTSQTNGKVTFKLHCDLVAQYKIVPLWWSARDVWADGEIDFPEGNIGSAFMLVSHNVTGTPATNAYIISPVPGGYTTAQTHIYDIEWTPWYVKWSLDGVQVGFTTGISAIPVMPMRFELQMEVADLSGATIPLTTNIGHVYFDWVSQYTYTGFARGVTRPISSGDPDALGSTDNVGIGVYNNGTTMATLVGDQTVAPGTTLSYKRIQGFVTLGAGAFLDHCIVEGRHQSSFISNALITAADGAKIQYCHIRPSAAALAGNVAYWLNGINVSGTVTVQRCDISRVVDAWRCGTASSKINFWSNRTHDYCFFDNDADQAGSTPASWSHGDVGGQRTVTGLGDSIIGNSIESFLDDTGVTWSGGGPGVGTASAGAGTVGMPQTALNNGYPLGDWGNLISYTNVGGHTGSVISFNWFHGGNNASFQITVGTGSSVKLEGNRCGCDGHKLGSGKQVITTWPSDTVVDVSGAPNVFDTTPDVPAALRGQPWTAAAPQTATGFSVTPGALPSVTHGRQITAANTGHTAYFDSGLGRNVVDGDLTVHAGSVALSSLVADNGTITKHWFQGGLTIDRNNVTIRACKFNSGVSGFTSGVHHPFNLEYCTIDTPGAAGDDGINYQDYTALRCRIGGNSDGAKINGGCTLTECYIRTESQDSLDHNDGLQAVGSYAGNTVIRCNIDARPVNGSGGPNSAIMVADSSSGLQVWTDNWVAGGGYVLRLYENSTYNVQGNDVLNNSWVFGPTDRAVIPPTNVIWGTTSANHVVDAVGAIVSTLSAP